MRFSRFWLPIGVQAIYNIMEGKKSFLLYCDQIGLFEQLPDEQAGKLIKLIFAYVNDQNPDIDDLLLKVAFEPIKLQLKRDLKQWGAELEQRSNSGQIGNLKRWHKDIYNRYVKKEITLTEALLIAKDRKVSHPDKSDSPPIANIAGNDTVTVNDTVTNNLNAEQARPVYDNFLKFFNEKMNRAFKGCDKSRRQFAARIKQGYTAQDFAKAIEALKNDKYHIDCAFKNATPEFITRPDKLEKFINQVNSNPDRYNVGEVDYDEKWSLNKS